MKRQITTLVILAGLTLSAVAEDEQQKKEQPVRPAVTKKTPDELPAGIAQFNGMLVGRLVKKDIEKGTFILNVDAVPRVWRNSKAENPKSVIGKNVEVDGVSGKWLDVLLLVKEGETLEFESRHDGGDRLTFPGELLRKVAPYDPGDYPVLPEAFRGFNGAVAAKIVKKDPQTFELIVEVDRVIDTWKNNRAKQPSSIAGKQMMLAGFWRRKDQYHGLKVGDRIEVGLQHIGLRSDHLTVAEFVRKAVTDGTPARTGEDSTETSRAGFPAGMRGFSGMLVGRLVEKDIEKGTFALNVDAVPRVWRNNQASDPRSVIGRQVKVDGVSGKWLDVLLLVKKGETLEFEAKHNGKDGMTFPGELLRKVAKVEPGDYPALPEEFRGFNGLVTGKIARKDETLKELTLQIGKVKNTSEKNRAKNPQSIIGRQIMVIGFWRQRDAYDGLKVGDTIECALQHIQSRSDHLNVGEFRKVAAEAQRD